MLTYVLVTIVVGFTAVGGVILCGGMLCTGGIVAAAYHRRRNRISQGDEEDDYEGYGEGKSDDKRIAVVSKPEEVGFGYQRDGRLGDGTDFQQNRGENNREEKRPASFQKKIKDHQRTPHTCTY